MRASASFRLPSPPLDARRGIGLRRCSVTSLAASRSSSSKSSFVGNTIAKNHSSKPRNPIKKQDQGRREVGGGIEEVDKEVHCEVEVVSWRETRIRAWISVNADVTSVWNVLTDYERLADFIPNLVYSGRIPCPHKGRIWLEQRGLQRALYWKIEARVVLDLQELPTSAKGSELRFSLVDGDFKKFEGKWSMKTGPRSSISTLFYELSVIPRFNFPAIFLERIIRSDLPVNLRALACRAEESYEDNQSSVIAEADAAFKTSYYSLGMSGDGSTTDAAYGTTLPSPSTKSSTKWGVYGKVCRLDRQFMVDEIHLRRYDGLLENGGAHSCVVASITVKAPVREVWAILTAYEALPEIVPNLAISKVLSRDNNKVRILQEGCKGLLYMVLHARVVLDLHEEFEHEISFQQVEGDFDSFQGKWTLEQLGDQHTLLKYSVESKMHQDTFLSEAILEEVIYEDLPSNLCAIRDCVEDKVALKNSHLEFSDEHEYQNNNGSMYSETSGLADSTPNPDVSNRLTQRPKVPGLQRDIEVLRAEIAAFISKYGQEGFMPMRKQLRLHGRVDIEKAITRMGGFRRIANLMNFSLAYKQRKPKGYWDNLENLQDEITQFQNNWGMDPAYMPSRKSFERAGRYDIARALEKWGGLQEVSRLLSLELRHSRRRQDSEREGQPDPNTPTGLDDQETTLNKPNVAQDAQKWLLKLKDLDINWVE